MPLFRYLLEWEGDKTGISQKTCRMQRHRSFRVEKRERNH